MMKLPNCPTCPGDVELLQEGATLRCPQCRQRYSMPSNEGADSIGEDSDPSMDDTIDTPSHAASFSGGEVPQAQGEALKLPFSEAFMQVYEPVSFLGKGAMGMVYLMRQVKLDRLVAVKVVNADSLTADVSRRLVQEAKVLASLNHANILGIFDVGEDNGLPYMVSEYVKGEPLNERLRREPPLNLIQNLRIILHVLDGLRAAHKQGVVHRDLKPSNVFLTSTGKPKIGDFGLAKSQNAPSGTAVGRILGTPGYMSPEQCRGRQVTAASDLYAVGIMLFELVAGRRPFQGPQLLDYLRQHTSEAPPRLRDIRPDVPSSIDAVVTKALQKDPNDRFRSATDFKRTLQEIHRTLSPNKDLSTNTSRTWGNVSTGADLIPGAKLADRYELVKILGHGGMGQVWMAKDEIRQGVKVAVKLLPPELWRDPEARSNLVGEANIALQLSHPDIVRLINIEPGESPFLVMELVMGPTLSEELSRRKKLGYGPMKPYETLVVMEAISRALDYAHDRNVIHRDIKPSNLILTLQDDHIVGAKLADFGIAAELASFKTRVTGAAPAGTLSYMSPEQVTCQKLDRRADVYSLGATLFQMLTGQPPYQGDEIAGAIKSAPVPDPVGVPLAVAAVVKAALAKDANGRPGTAGELFQRLRDAVGDGPTGAQRATQKSVAAHRADESQDASIQDGTGASQASSVGYRTSPTTPTKADRHEDKSEPKEESRAEWQMGVSDCANAQESIDRMPYQMTVDHQLPKGGLDALLAQRGGKAKPAPQRRGLMTVVALVIFLGAFGLGWPMIKPQLEKLYPLASPSPRSEDPPPATDTPTTVPTVVPSVEPAPTKEPVAKVTASPSPGPVEHPESPAPASVAPTVAPTPPPVVPTPPPLEMARVTIDVNERGLPVETIDGTGVGITGSPINLKPGATTLIIRSMNFEDVQLSVELQPGEKKTYKPVLNRRQVSVKVTTVPAGAEIFIDDVSRGKVSDVLIQAGRPTRISASLPGYKTVSDRLTVDANKEKEISLVLPPDDVEVQVKSTPPGAQVLGMTGAPIGVTPMTFKVAPGHSLQYTLALAGYEPAQVSGNAVPGEALVLARDLKKLPDAPTASVPAPTPAASVSALSDNELKARNMRLEVARALFLKHDWDQAEGALLEVLAVDPQHVDSLLMLARVYMGSQMTERAEDSVRKAYEIQPTSGEVLDMYVAVLITNSNLKRAEEMSKALVSLNPKNPSYLATLATVYCLQDKHKDAKEVAEKALKMKPDMATTKALKGLIQKKCN